MVKVNELAGQTEGVVKLAFAQGSVAVFDDLTTASDDEITVITAVETATAAQLITIDGATGVNVNANALTKITSDSITDLITATADSTIDIDKGADGVEAELTSAITSIATNTVANINTLASQIGNHLTATFSNVKASDIKTLKPVEPYKAKGIKERGQYVLRKEGKKK